MTRILHHVAIACFVAVAIAFGFIWTRSQRAERFIDRAGWPLFLTKAEAKDVYSGPSMADLLARMQYRECVVRSGGKVTKREIYRRQMLGAYLDGVMEFDDLEQEVLRGIVADDPDLSRMRLRFIKLKDGLDWNFPYTVDDCIILPEKFLKSMKPAAVAKTLVHEAAHVQQRRHQGAFDVFYKRPDAFAGCQWVKADRLTLPQSIKDHAVTNPDSPVADWVCKTRQGDFYWLCMEMNDESTTPDKWAYTVVQESVDEYRVTHNKQRIETLMDTVLQGFASATSPNELFAYAYAAARKQRGSNTTGFMTAAAKLMSL